MISTGNDSLLRSAILITVISALGACASQTQAPDDLAAEAETRIDTATEAQAESEAPVALRTARDQLSDGRQAMRTEKYDLARQYLEKAIVNAEYAIVKSRSEKMQRAAEEVRQTIDTLRIELDAQQSS